MMLFLFYGSYYIRCDVINPLQEIEDGLYLIVHAEPLSLIAVNTIHPLIGAFGIVVCLRMGDNYLFCGLHIVIFGFCRLRVLHCTF